MVTRMQHLRVAMAWTTTVQFQDCMHCLCIVGRSALFDHCKETSYRDFECLGSPVGAHTCNRVDNTHPDTLA